LQHVDEADRHLAIERLAGPAIKNGDLSGMIEARETEHLFAFGLLFALEHGRCNRDAMAQVAAKFDETLLVQRFDGLVIAIDFLEHVLQRPRVVPRIVSIDRLPDLEPKAGTSPAEMRLENLTDVHPARHAEGIEHDVDRGAILQERHVLGGHDFRNDALVAVTTGHLVAGLDLALHGDEDLYHFY